MEYRSTIPHDAKTFLSFRGVDLLKEETEPNPDWGTIVRNIYHRTILVLETNTCNTARKAVLV